MKRFTIPSPVIVKDQMGSVMVGHDFSPTGELSFSSWVVGLLDDPGTFGTGSRAILASARLEKIFKSSKPGKSVFLEDNDAELLKKSMENRSQTHLFLPFFNRQCVSFFEAIDSMETVSAEEQSKLKSV